MTVRGATGRLGTAQHPGLNCYFHHDLELMGTLLGDRGLHDWIQDFWNGVTVGTNDAVSRTFEMRGAREVRVSATMAGSTDWDVLLRYYETQKHSTSVRTQKVSTGNGAGAEVDTTAPLAHPFAEVEFANNDGSNAGTLDAAVHVS